MTTPLSQFRDLSSLLFRVVDPNARFDDIDRLLHKLHDVLSESATSPRPTFLEPLFVQELLRPPTPPTLVIHPDQKAEPIPSADIVVKPEPSTVRNVVYNPSPLVHAVKLEAPQNPDDSMILKEIKSNEDEEEDEDIGVTPDDDEDEEEAQPEDEDAESDGDADEDEDAESDSDADEDAESDDDADEDAESDSDAEGEEEEEEEEDITLLKIKKEKYYWSPTSKRVYEYQEEGYGDCIGTYVDGKIVSK